MAPSDHQLARRLYDFSPSRAVSMATTMIEPPAFLPVCRECRSGRGRARGGSCDHGGGLFPGRCGHHRRQFGHVSAERVVSGARTGKSLPRDHRARSIPQRNAAAITKAGSRAIAGSHGWPSSCSARCWEQSPETPRPPSRRRTGQRMFLLVLFIADLTHQWLRAS
jgi:hypothetical protein